ncbi:unnamed protein product [Oreochromis niloticus]|nr:unnamed protein product [Mustela putorius furo]
MLPQRPLPPIPSKAPTVNVNTRKNLPVKHHMVQDKKVSSPSKSLPNSGKDTVNSGKSQNMFTDNEVVQTAATMKELSVPVLSESPFEMTKKTSSQTISDQKVQDLPIENNELDRTNAGQLITEEDTTGRSLLKSGNDNNKYIDESQNTVFSEVFQKVSEDLYSLKMHIDIWKAKYASSVNADELVEKEIQQYLQRFFERRLAESSCGILKKTSSQTLSDQTVQDLPTEHDELDNTKAGQPITDSSLSTDRCEDHAEDVSAGSKLESMASESHDEKPKGRTHSQKFKRAVKKLFQKKKTTTSEAPDDESARQSSASPESTLTDDEAMQDAANMKEQLSQPVLPEDPPDMTKKTSSQTLSDQTVQDLPTEHDELDNTKAGQPITDSSLSTDRCEDHAEDVSAGSKLESMASESHDEKPKGRTHSQKFKRAVKKLFQKKKTTTSEAPDDESARQSSASPESTLTDDEAMQDAANMKEQLSQPVLPEDPPDMTKKTSSQTLSDQTVQDLPTEHDELDNTKAGQPITDSSLSTDRCEDHAEDVSAGSKLESMASESHDEKPKGRTHSQKFKRAVKKLFQKKKTTTSEAPDDESARQSSASPESTLTDDEAMQDAANMKEQLSQPVLPEDPPDMTKKTSSQTLSDQTVQDLPTEHDELDNTKAGQPITDSSLSTDRCEDHAEDVSAGSKLESMASESHDEKPKGRTHSQKFKRAVKKLFQKKKTTTSEAPDDESARQSSASPESTLTDDEAMQDAANMKEQLSQPVLPEDPPDMTKKTSSQTLSDQTVQDLPTEHDELDNTKAGQPITDSSLSTDRCEDHAEDVSAGSKLESMASESHDEKPKGRTHSQKFKRAVKKLFQKKKTTTSEAPDDESARQSSASPESTLTDDEAMQDAANMKEQLSQPVLPEDPPDMTKKTSSQTLSDQTVQDLPTEHDELDNTKAGQPITDSSLSTDSCEDHAEDVSAESKLESMASESHDEKPKGKTPFQKFKRAVTKRFRKKKIATRRQLQSTDSESQDETPKRKTRLQKFKRAVKKLFQKKKTTTSEAPDNESARQSSASPESTLTDDEAMQDAANMKEQLSQPVLPEDPPNMTKKTSSQTLSDQTVQDLPTEHDELDNTKAGQPITDSSLSTDSCEDHAGDVSAESKLESMASESHDEKPKGKTPFQKFKRAVTKRFRKKKIATGRELQSTDSESRDETPKRKTRLQKFKRAVKKLFQKKKTTTSEAPDDESARQSSASPESTLTDDEAMQDAANMKEQLSQPVLPEDPPDMTKKTSSQTLSDQTVQDLPTEHDELDNTKAGQPITDSSLSTDSCEDHAGDVSAESKLESMASESHDEKPKGKTPFQKFKRAVTKRFRKKKIATGRELQSTDSESQDETPKRKTRLQKFKRAVKKLFQKKKTTTSEAPDDESARQSSASPESTLTDDEAMQDAANMKEQLSQPVLPEDPPDMTKKTSSQTLSDQTVQDLPTEHDELDNTKAGQPITDSSLSTDRCEDHAEDVSAGSKLESMASESHDEKPKGKTPFQKLKRAVTKRFHKKKVATSDAPEDTSNTFKTEAEGVAEDANSILNEEIDIEVLKKQFTEVCIDVLQYIRDSSVTLSFQSNYHLPR